MNQGTRSTIARLAVSLATVLALFGCAKDNPRGLMGVVQPKLKVAAANKVLSWRPNPAAEHIVYYTLYMKLSPTFWWRMGTTRVPRITLPAGPYVRTFAVTATNPDIPTISGESAKSQPITIQL